MFSKKLIEESSISYSSFISDKEIISTLIKVEDAYSSFSELIELYNKIQSNEEINFVTLNFTGSGTNVVKIIGSEYLVGLIEIPFESDPQKSSETNLEELPEIFSSGYFVWLILGGILIIVVAYVIIKIQKNKN